MRALSAVRRAPLLLALLLNACLVDEPKPQGLLCDGEHPCPEGLSCIEGACLPPCVDERLGTACSVGVGECRAEGTWVCLTRGVVCDATERPQAEEICDGRDNDCDGAADEDLPAPACAKTRGVCEGRKKTCGGEAGWLECKAADYGPDYEVAETLCDEKDNDCDGEADDVEGGCDCLGGEVRECGSDVGECVKGTQECGPEGRFGPCEGGVKAAEESCNGKDDDCSGTADDNLAAPACALAKGVCEGSTQRCGGEAGWLPCAGAEEYGADFEAKETRCDGKDNDCDGEADTGLTPPACDLAEGVCAGKVKRCGGEQGWLPCGQAEYGDDWEQKEARCDGKDNDCDGKPDQGLPAPACEKADGVCAGKVKRCGGEQGWLACEGTADYGGDWEEKETRCDGKDNDCDGKVDSGLTAPACDKIDGVCAGKVKRCGGDKGWLACEGKADYGELYETAETLCDGLDNDCSGKADDGLTAPACDKVDGVCAGKVKRCGGEQGWLACAGTVDYGEGWEEAESRCDGKDNDCDGKVDVGLTPPACALQDGVCAGKVKRCGGEQGWLACAGTADYGSEFEESETRCDAKDNDCDGAPDAFDSPPACPKTAGVCAGSSQPCAGAGFQTCSAATYGADYEASETRCDGKDNDCDEQTDEGLSAPDCEKQQGVCRGAKKTCGGAAGWKVCAKAEYGSAYQETETLCDGLDNDCDGTVDRVPGCVSTASGTPPPGYAGGSLMEARFDRPAGLLPLANGDLLLSDARNHVVRRVSLSKGTVTVEAGTVGQCGKPANAEPVLATAGKLCEPRGLLLGLDGTVYIADSGNHMIRTLKDGKLGLLAGDGTSGHKDNADPMLARFNGPTSLGLFPDLNPGGWLVVADGGNCALRVVTLGDSAVYTLTGGNLSSSCGSLASDAPVNASTAVFGQIPGIAVDPDTYRVYVADPDNYRVRYLDLTTSPSTVSTFAGSTYGYGEGTGTGAKFKAPAGLWIGASEIFVADRDDHRVRALTFAGVSRTVAGSGNAGAKDGQRTVEARLGEPAVLAEAGGVLYFAGALDHRLRKVQGDEVVTVAGGAATAHADGGLKEAVLFTPWGLAVDGEGNAYFTEQYNHAIRKLAPDGTVTTVAGQVGTSGTSNGTLLGSRFNQPMGLRIRADGTLVVADWGNNKIRLVDIANNQVSTLAGDGSYGFRDGAALSAAFSSPAEVELGPNDSVFVGDINGRRIRRIQGGQVTTIAGTGVYGRADGPGASATLACPFGLRVGPDGDLYFADRCLSSVRRIDLDDVALPVTTVAGIHTCAGETEGPALEASLCGPMSLGFQGSDLFIVSWYSSTLRKLSNGQLTIVSGTPFRPGHKDGALGGALFNEPSAIAPAPGGGFYVTDLRNNRIRRVMP